MDTALYLILILVLVVSVCLMFNILGSIPWTLGSSKHLIEVVKDHRVKYGDISSLDLVRFFLVLLNEPKLIKEALNMEELAGRPQ